MSYLRLGQRKRNHLPCRLSRLSLSADNSSSRGNALAESDGSSRHINRSVTREKSSPSLVHASLRLSFSSKLSVRVHLLKGHLRFATTIPASFAWTSSVAHRVQSRSDKVETRDRRVSLSFPWLRLLSRLRRWNSLERLLLQL